MTDWHAAHERAVARFCSGWDRPEPHAWDELIAPEMQFVQPMLRDGTGPQHWWGETARTLALLPDLRAEVLTWAGSGETLFIHIRFNATLAGRPLSWEAVDLLKITPDGAAFFRESFFDSMPIAAQVLSRPRSWMRWWSSGVGPFFTRRRVLQPPRTRPDEPLS